MSFTDPAGFLNRVVLSVKEEFRMMYRIKDSAKSKSEIPSNLLACLSTRENNKQKLNNYYCHTQTLQIPYFTSDDKQLYLPTHLVFPGVSKFFIKSPGLPVRAPNLPGNTFCGFFYILQSKIKQEVDLIELFYIGKRKTEQCNWCIILTSIAVGQKSANQIAQ